MASRWNTEYCDGGLRWQIFTWNSGYDYKNSVSNGCLFHLAARLARYTGNQTFVEWGEKVWDWLFQVQFVYNGTTEYRIFDGAYITDNCTGIFQQEWTYNYGLMISGCAYLYNYTGEEVWLDRAKLIWNRTQVFFHNQIVYEAACAPLTGVCKCDTDMLCFKGILMRFLGLVMLMAPDYFQAEIWPYVETSAQAAAASCSGGTDGHTCGFTWFNYTWDGTWGLGQQIDALDTFNTLLINTMPGPYTQQDLGLNETYGDAGLNTTDTYATALILGTKDKVGAGILTAAVVLTLMGSTWWLLK
jgi:mannan endo-1,6-alpha-mannosidase